MATEAIDLIASVVLPAPQVGEDKIPSPTSSSSSSDRESAPSNTDVRRNEITNPITPPSPPWKGYVKLGGSKRAEEKERIRQDVAESVVEHKKVTTFANALTSAPMYRHVVAEPLYRPPHASPRVQELEKAQRTISPAAARLRNQAIDLASVAGALTTRPIGVQPKQYTGPDRAGGGGLVRLATSIRPYTVSTVSNTSDSATTNKSDGSTNTNVTSSSPSAPSVRNKSAPGLRTGQLVSDLTLMLHAELGLSPLQRGLTEQICASAVEALQSSSSSSASSPSFTSTLPLSARSSRSARSIMSSSTSGRIRLFTPADAVEKAVARAASSRAVAPALPTPTLSTSALLSPPDDVSVSSHGRVSQLTESKSLVSVTSDAISHSSPRGLGNKGRRALRALSLTTHPVPKEHPVHDVQVSHRLPHTHPQGHDLITSRRDIGYEKGRDDDNQGNNNGSDTNTQRSTKSGGGNSYNHSTMNSRQLMSRTAPLSSQCTFY